MTAFQKVIKGFAIALALFIIISIFVGAAELVFDIFDVSDGVLEETQLYSVSGDIRSIDVEINSANFQIKEGNTFSVESNIKNLSVSEDNGTLTLEEERKLINHGNNEGALLILTVPAGTVFDRAEILAGAGSFTVDILAAKELVIQFGAGEAVIENLIATQNADIEGGVGRVEIKNGTLNNLDFEVGVGTFLVTSRLEGEGALEFGVGSATVTLLGKRDDYSLDIDKGLGEIKIDGVSSDSSVIGSGSHTLDIDGGIGSVEIIFLEQ